MRDSGNGYLKSFQDAVEAMARNPVAMDNPARAKQLASFGAMGLAYGVEADPHELGQAICALFGGAIVDALTKAVDTMDVIPGGRRVVGRLPLGLQLLDLDTQAFQAIFQPLYGPLHGGKVEKHESPSMVG
ncbi:MAG: hypothetical protein JSR49_15420 [Proteobacteria bacterium]|nr:hypothetical protein [Pseudomonadota bacterium]